MHLYLIFHFDVMAATSVCLLICQYCWKGNFELNSFDSICNYQNNVMWCNKTTQIVHSNLYFSSVSAFSVNYVEYCSIQQYALYHNVSRYNCFMTRELWRVSYLEVLASTQPYLEVYFKILKAITSCITVTSEIDNLQ